RAHGAPPAGVARTGRRLAAYGIGMTTPRIHLPAPIASLPWKMLSIVLALTGFGLLVLYSAAGGHMTWALPQGIRFFMFLGMAIGMSFFRPQFYKEWSFLAYAGVFVMLVGVEALGAI